MSLPVVVPAILLAIRRALLEPGNAEDCDESVRKFLERIIFI
jgi:hypothetical protein